MTQPPFGPQQPFPQPASPGATGYDAPGWAVGPSDARQAAPLESDIPTLFLIGQFDPFAPGELIADAASRFATAHVAVFPGRSHNPLTDWGDEAHPGCATGIVRQWLDHPRSAPDETCLATLPTVEFSTTLAASTAYRAG